MNNKILTYLSILIPLLWLIRSASRGITYWLNPDAGMNLNIDYLQGSPVDRNFLLTLEIIAVVILLLKRVDWRSLVKNNAILLLLYVYMGITIIWSDFAVVSLKRWVRVCGDLLMILLVITEFKFTSKIAFILKACSYTLIPLSVIFIKYFRDIGVMYDTTGSMEMWIGVTTHKNSLGQLACISSIFLFWNLFSKKYNKNIADVIVFALSAWLLLGSSSAASRTSLGIGIFAVLFFLFLKMIKKRAVYVRAGVLIIVSSTLLISTISSYFFNRNAFTSTIVLFGGDPTLTGRTLLWEEIIKIANEYQPFGKGYGSFWIGDLANDLWKKFVWHPGQAHNGYVDVYVDIGLIGLILLSLAIISSYKNIMLMVESKSEYGMFRLLIFSMVIIYNITETSFLKPTSLLWFMFLLVSIKVPEKYPEKEMEQYLQNKNKIQQV
jgi:O-antigen ligase